MGGKNCPRGKNCPWAHYSENNSATRVTIYKRIDVRERLRRELLHTPIRPATGPHVVKRGGPSGPKESSGWSPRFPPARAGTNKGQRSHARRPPLGQPQLNVPRERSRPRGRPLQPRFPKEHHHRRAADDSLCGLVPQSNVVVSLEMEREEGGGRSWPPPQRRRSAPQGLLRFVLAFSIMATRINVLAL